MRDVVGFVVSNRQRRGGLASTTAAHPSATSTVGVVR
jgi:hypothetical protein